MQLQRPLNPPRFSLLPMYTQSCRGHGVTNMASGEGCQSQFRANIGRLQMLCHNYVPGHVEQAPPITSRPRMKDHGVAKVGLLLH